MNYMHIHTLRQMPPFSQSAYTNTYSKPKITWNNTFSVSNQNIKNSNKKLLGWHIPNPPLETDVLTHAHTQLMADIIFIKNWQSWG